MPGGADRVRVRFQNLNLLPTGADAGRGARRKIAKAGVAQGLATHDTDEPELFQREAAATRSFTERAGW